jgi:hypothetical protein
MKKSALSVALVVFGTACSSNVMAGGSEGKLIKGGKADDVLIAYAISGEPAIAQDYEAADTGAKGPNGETLRADDPDDPVQEATRTYFPGQSYDDHLKTMIGGKGRIGLWCRRLFPASRRLSSGMSMLGEQSTGAV